MSYTLFKGLCELVWLPLPHSTGILEDMMSALRNALSEVKSEIHTIPVNHKSSRTQKFPAKGSPLRPKQFINGNEVYWGAPTDDSRKIPYIQTDDFYVQYPSKAVDIKLPEGAVRATYNSDKKRVEFFKAGSDEVIRYVADARHEPLPTPRYFSELEKVEEIFDINFETGEVTSGMNIDVLPEATHWRLRLQEFEAQQLRAGVAPKVISFRLQKYLKNLEATRGLTVEQLSQPIPQSVTDAIKFAEMKQAKASVGANNGRN